MDKMSSTYQLGTLAEPSLGYSVEGLVMIVSIILLLFDSSPLLRHAFQEDNFSQVVMRMSRLNDDRIRANFPRLDISCTKVFISWIADLKMGANNQDAVCSFLRKVDMGSGPGCSQLVDAIAARMRYALRIGNSDAIGVHSCAIYDLLDPDYQLQHLRRLFIAQRYMKLLTSGMKRMLDVPPSAPSIGLELYWRLAIKSFEGEGGLSCAIESMNAGLISVMSRTHSTYRSTVANDSEIEWIVGLFVNHLSVLLIHRKFGLACIQGFRDISPSDFVQLITMAPEIGLLGKYLTDRLIESAIYDVELGKRIASEGRLHYCAGVSNHNNVIPKMRTSSLVHSDEGAQGSTTLRRLSSRILLLNRLPDKALASESQEDLPEKLLWQESIGSIVAAN